MPMQKKDKRILISILLVMFVVFPVLMRVLLRRPAGPPPRPTAEELYEARMPRGVLRRLGTIDERHAYPIRSASFSSDGQLVATADIKKNVFVWRIEGGQPVANLSGGITVKFHPSNPLLAIGGELPWDEYHQAATAGSATASSDGGDGDGAAPPSPDPLSRDNYEAERTRVILLWDVETRKTVNRIDVDGTHQFHFSRDGKRLVVIENKRVTLWNLDPLEKQAEIDEPFRYDYSGKQGKKTSFDSVFHVLASDLHPTKSLLATSTTSASGSAAVQAQLPGSKNDLFLHDLDQIDSTPSRTDFGFRSQNNITMIRFSPDGTLLALALRNGNLGLLTLALKKMEPIKNADAEAMAFSPDGRFFVYAGHFSRNTLYVRDVARVKLATTYMDGPRQMINTIAFSRDGKHLLTGTDRGMVHLWDAKAALNELSRPVLPADP